jgi:hypothetical protein
MPVEVVVDPRPEEGCADSQPGYITAMSPDEIPPVYACDKRSIIVHGACPPDHLPKASIAATDTIIDLSRNLSTRESDAE